MHRTPIYSRQTRSWILILLVLKIINGVKLWVWCKVDKKETCHVNMTCLRAAAGAQRRNYGLEDMDYQPNPKSYQPLHIYPRILRKHLQRSCHNAPAFLRQTHLRPNEIHRPTWLNFEGSRTSSAVKLSDWKLACYEFENIGHRDGKHRFWSRRSSWLWKIKQYYEMLKTPTPPGTMQ